MIVFALMAMTACASLDAPQATSDPRAFFAVLDALHSDIEDFRCEYEGTVTFTDKAIQELRKLKSDGLDERFNGRFVWKNGGDTLVDVFHEDAPTGQITREQLVVTGARAENYVRMIDAALGSAVVQDSALVNSNRSASLGSIFLIDTIKRFSQMQDMSATIGAETIEGRPCSVLTFTQISSGFRLQRYWIDMHRGGNTVRRETYAPTSEGPLTSRTEIKLAPFKIGDAQVWLPVAGVIESHSAIKDGKPFYPKAPTRIESIGIAPHTLEFNRHPGRDAFSIKYKPGTPITDNLKKLQYEFAQQKAAPRPSRSEAEASLKAQLALAENQKRELIAESPLRSGTNWSTRLVWVFGTIALVLSVLALVLKRR